MRTPFNVKLKSLLGGSIAVATASFTILARADVIYQSIPNLAAAPSLNGLYSTGFDYGQSIGEVFSPSVSGLRSALRSRLIQTTIGPARCVQRFQQCGSHQQRHFRSHHWQQHL